MSISSIWKLQSGPNLLSGAPPVVRMQRIVLFFELDCIYVLVGECGREWLAISHGYFLDHLHSTSQLLR